MKQMSQKVTKRVLESPGSLVNFFWDNTVLDLMPFFASLVNATRTAVKEVLWTEKDFISSAMFPLYNQKIWVLKEVETVLMLEPSV